MNYPFTHFDQIKPHVAGVNATFEISLLHSSLLLAADEIKNIISEAMYEKIIQHFIYIESLEDYDKDAETDVNIIRLNLLLDFCQGAIANFSFYHHFPFILAEIGNHGVTIVNEENRKTVGKSLSDELKESFVKIAWLNADKMITFLNKEATIWSIWTPNSIYKVAQIVKNEDVFWQCQTEHVSSTTFQNDILNWLTIDKSNIVFVEWTESFEFSHNQNLLFDNTIDFHNRRAIDKSAYFYSKIAYIIHDLIEDEIKSRVADFDNIIVRKRTHCLTAQDFIIITLAKKAVAAHSLAIACRDFDYYELPMPYRKRLLENQSLTRTQEEATVKMSLYKTLYNEAITFYRRIEVNRSDEKQKTEPIDNYTPYTETVQDITSIAFML